MSGAAACYRASVGENTRDAGLVRALGPWALAASIVNMVVGAGIFAVPASLAASVGPFAPLAFLVCAIAVGYESPSTSCAPRVASTSDRKLSRIAPARPGVPSPQR